MAWRAAAVLLMAAVLVGQVRASWKWEKDSTQRPASASSVVTSSSSTSTSSSSSVAIGTQHEVLVAPKTVVQPETSGSDAEQEGPPTHKKSSRALDAGPSDTATPDLEEAPSDVEPRFIGHLKKKLCSVGLGFNCGHKGHKPAAHHYGQPVDPHDIQYVQPVEIRPVGKPIPAIPYSHGSSYGSSHGSGHGNSHGSGHGNSHGSGHGNIHGSGHGNSHGSGHGNSHGSGHGASYGSSHGSGHGNNHGSGHDASYGSSHGSGHGNSHGSGHSNNHGIGHGNSYGSSHGSGHGNFHGNSYSNSHGGGHGSSYGIDHGNSHGTEHFNSHGGDAYTVVSGPVEYGGAGEGGFLPASGGAYTGPAHHDGYPEPQDLYPYGAASTPSDIYGPPKAASVIHAAPSSGFDVSQVHPSGYDAQQVPSSGYIAPEVPSSGYIAPEVPFSGYIAPEVPPSSHVAPQAPPPLYDGSKSSGGSSSQAVKHIHIHQHTYKLDTADGGGVGGFGLGGGYDANLIYGSDKSFSSASLALGKENVNAEAPAVDTKNSGLSVNSLPGPQDVFIIAPPVEYSAGSDGAVELIRGVREPSREGRPREVGCTCVPVDQCPQELTAASPFAREDLTAFQDPRNSPSVAGVLSNASRPLLRQRRESQLPYDQIAVPSQDQFLKQSKELFPDIARFDSDPFTYDGDHIALPDTSQLNAHRVVHPSPYPNIKIVNSDLTVQAPIEGPVGPQAASPAASFLAPTPVPMVLSAGQTDTAFVRRQREGEVQDVTQQYQDVLVTNKEVVFKDCKGGHKKVRSRRETKEKDSPGQSSPVPLSREAPATGRSADNATASPRFLGPVGDFLSNIPFGITLRLSNLPHLSSPAFSPLHAPDRAGAHLSPSGAQLPPGGPHLPPGGAHLPPGGAHLPLGGAPFSLGGAHLSPGGAHLSPGSPSPLGPLPLRLTPPHGLSPMLGPPRLLSPLTPPQGLLSPLLPPTLPLTSPGIATSLYPPYRQPRPLTLVDKKVGPAATLHDSTGSRHPPPLHDLGPPVYGVHRPKRPFPGVHGHRDRTCYYVSCTTLAHYCQPQLVPPPGVNCGLYEVCCSLETYHGASSSVFNSFSAGACGVKNSAGVNGRINQLLQQEGDAEFGEYPWQAAVLKKEGYDNVYVCAATLIDERHVLTAAHCVKGYEAFELRIRLGEWDVNRDTEFYPYFESDVNAVYVNPDFYSGNLINDIAIIRMSTPVDFIRNPHIGPVCMPTRADFTGQRCWVSGWGKNDFGLGGQYQNVLKEVDLVVVSPGVCEAALHQTRLGPTYRLHPGMLCAGGQLGKDACKGDGGGPLACESPDGSYQLAGIVSWGIGCGADGVPGVYVNVAYYLEWIYRITKY